MIKNTLRLVFDSLYKDSDMYFESVLTSMTPIKPVFYHPLADAKLLLSWEKILIHGSYSSLPADIKIALKKIVTIQHEKVESFDFGRIQSMTCSKGFGRNWMSLINGSWFKDVYSWGQAMYNDSPFSDLTSNPISGLSQQDFENNIKHIEGEGFSLKAPLSINYYSWFDRYTAIQTGGSHHAAMAIKQINNDGMEYTREADVTSYSLDFEAAREFSSKYFVFITSEQAYCNHQTGFDGELKALLREFVTRDIFTVPMTGSKNTTYLYIIPKKHLKVDAQVFESWLETNIERNLIIDFLDILQEPLKYCTHHYSHPLKSIYLADPNRINDKYVSQVLSENDSNN